ncbi:MAG TPA: FtsQ-type POTRA domain-containing protein [Clostridiales bacterium]|nr:FtsQ-type POTRA domain-containing protein [Clostridiales bacterium]HPV01618.1 FtsQ-type POTRA domain-containing protein [Clostridiales bacterium]
MKLRRIKAVQAEEPAHVINRRKRRRRRILRAVRSLLVTALFAFTIVYAALSPFFNIKEIKVVGETRYDAAELAAASGIRTGRNGFRVLFSSESITGFFRIGDAEKAIIEKCPYVRSAEVRYIIPGTVRISVTEREPVAIIELKGIPLLIDKDGYLLEVDPELDTERGKNELPVIRTADPGSAVPGKKLDIPEEMLLSAFKVFDTIREADAMNDVKLLPLVDYVDTSDLSNIRFSLESRIIVNLGRVDELFYKINAAASIFTKNIKINERGTLDFSVGKDPVFTPESGG